MKHFFTIILLIFVSCGSDNNRTADRNPDWQGNNPVNPRDNNNSGSRNSVSEVGYLKVWDHYVCGQMIGADSLPQLELRNDVYYIGSRSSQEFLQLSSRIVDQYLPNFLEGCYGFYQIEVTGSIGSEMKEFGPANSPQRTSVRVFHVNQFR